MRGNVTGQYAGQKGKNAVAKRLSRYKVEGYRKQREYEPDELKRELLRLRLLAEESAELGKRPRWRRLKLRLKRIAADLLT